MFRHAGKQRRMTIGRFPIISLAKARAEAKDALEAVKKGFDPERLREASVGSAIEADGAAQLRRFRTITADHILRHHRGVVKGGKPKEPPNNRSWEEVERVFEKYVLPVWGDRDIATIRRADVGRLLAKVEAENGPIMANRVLAHVRKLFNWALVQPGLMDVLETSPIVPGMAPAAETERDRYLSKEEIAWLWSSAEALGDPFGPFVRLLLVTGQRRDEVAGMEWAQVDTEQRIWTLEKKSTKARRKHEVMLSDLALEILRGVPRTKSPLVFTTTGTTPISGFSGAKRSIDKLVDERRKKEAADGIPPAPDGNGPLEEAWRFHDLRRTMASHMEDTLGINRSMISAILNHAEAGATAVYTKGTLRNHKLAAMQAWGRLIAKLAGKPDCENVVPLRN
jgi:integrase